MLLMDNLLLQSKKKNVCNVDVTLTVAILDKSILLLVQFF